MKNNILFKLLASIPLILIMLYFIPFLGICLILLRFFMYDNKKKISTSIYIVVTGLIILLPKILKIVFDVTNINKIPYLKNIVDSELYKIDFINYSKRLICVGIVFLIIYFVIKTIFDKVSNKLNSGIKNYINETQRRDAEISKKNDMEIKLKQEKAKNTGYVKCPTCGADNIISDKFGTCKYCRSSLENKSFKG